MVRINNIDRRIAIYRRYSGHEENSGGYSQKKGGEKIIGSEWTSKIFQPRNLEPFLSTNWEKNQKTFIRRTK